MKIVRYLDKISHFIQNRKGSLVAFYSRIFNTRSQGKDSRKDINSKFV